MYQDSDDSTPIGMETTEMTTVLDSRLPRQRDPEAARLVLTMLLDFHSQRPLDAAVESARRSALSHETMVQVEARRRWEAQG